MAYHGMALGDQVAHRGFIQTSLTDQVSRALYRIRKPNPCDTFAGLYLQLAGAYRSERLSWRHTKLKDES